MEDANNEVSQVQRNQTQAYITNQAQISGNLKKFDKSSIFVIGGNSRAELVRSVSENSESDENEDDDNSDIISEHIGHIGSWQLFWAVMMCLFQLPTTFHIFCLVFQVSLISAASKIMKLTALPKLRFFFHFKSTSAFIVLKNRNHLKRE